MKIVTLKMLIFFKSLIGWLMLFIAKDMPKVICCMLLLTINTFIIAQSFKVNQLKNIKVNHVYNERVKSVDSLLNSFNISREKIEIFLLATKYERKLNVFAKNKYDSMYILIRTYDFCMTSGSLGPKRKEWDGQIPEGFYYINNFNPFSSYHLSLGINYPNESDRKLSHAERLGGSIFIHGDCVTIGCIPITDYWIEELYILCVEAKNNGQKKIPVHILPFRSDEYINKELNSFWNNLFSVHDFFIKNKTLTKIYVKEDGYYQLTRE